MRKIKTKAELKALGDQFPQPPPIDFEEPPRSILEPVFNCDICSQVFQCEEDLTNHEIKHMKLTCGLCNKNFKSKAAFEAHDKDHPSVEKMNTFKQVPAKIGKNKFECSVCKKKFKNETSLNYHDMFHTEDERKAAKGIEVFPTKNVIEGQLNYRDFDSEDDDFDTPTKKKNKIKKVVRKPVSNSVEKKKSMKKAGKKPITPAKLPIQKGANKIDTDESDDNSEFEISKSKSVKEKNVPAQTESKNISAPTTLPTNQSNTTRLSQPYSEISGDSDSDSASCDSKYLSLKHISRSMKKTSKPLPIVKHYSSSSEEENNSSLKHTSVANPVSKPINISINSCTEDSSDTNEDRKFSLKHQLAKQSKVIVKDTENKSQDEVTDCAPNLTISETDSEEDNNKKQKQICITTIDNNSEKIPDDQSRILEMCKSSSPKTIKRIKFSCEKCKKKFNDPMALEYHRITFHVEEDTASPSSSIDQGKYHSVTSSLKGNKLQKKKNERIAKAENTHKSKEIVHSESDSDTQKLNNKKRKATEKNSSIKQKAVKSDKTKSKCLTGIFRKRKPSESSDDESQIKRFFNLSSSNKIQPKISNLKRKIHETSSDSDEFMNEGKGNTKKKTFGAKNKRLLTKCKSKSGFIEGNISDSNHGFGSKNNSTDKEVSASKPKSNPKTFLPVYNKVKSSSGSEEISVNKKPKGYSDETSDEEMINIGDTQETKKQVQSEMVKNNKQASNITESVAENKAKKIMCDFCGQTMASQSILAYHKMRCTGDGRKSKEVLSEGDFRNESQNTIMVNVKNTEKKPKKAGMKRGGELKDLYAARSRKKVDYLEVSDFEESSDNSYANEPSVMDEIQVLAKADISSDESDFEVNKIVKKKVLKKKGTKKRSETSADDFLKSKVLNLKSMHKKGNDTTEDDLDGLSVDEVNVTPALKLLKKKMLPKKDSTSEDEKIEDNTSASKVKVPVQKTLDSDFDKSSLDSILLSTDEDKSLKVFYKSEDAKCEESQFDFQNKNVTKVINKVAKCNKKMVTSDSEPEIVKKETIKTEEIDEKNKESDENEALSNRIREKLLATKSEKVKCEICRKTFKNSVILQYHQLHCVVQKNSVSYSQNNLVEKKIISSKKSNFSESPVDKILKKLSEKVQNSATNSPNSSPNSVSSYKFFKTKNDEAKSPTHVPEMLRAQNTNSFLDVKCKICGIYSDPKSILEHIKECHDERISVSVKKISKYDLNKYKSDCVTSASDEDQDQEKAKTFEFCDDENSFQSDSEDNLFGAKKCVSGTLGSKSEPNNLNKMLDKTLKKGKKLSTKGALASKNLPVNNWKEITTDPKIPYKINQLKPMKAIGESIKDTEKTIKGKYKPNHNELPNSSESEFETEASIKGQKINDKPLEKCIKESKTKDKRKCKNASRSGENKIENSKDESEKSDFENFVPKVEESLPKKKSVDPNLTANSINQKTLLKGTQNKKYVDISDISEDEIKTTKKIENNEQKQETLEKSECNDSDSKACDMEKNDPSKEKVLNTEDTNLSFEQDEPAKKKKKSKKDKKKKSKKKSKKSKHKHHISCSSDSEEEERKKKRKKKHKKQIEDSDVSESPALDTSTTSIEEKHDVEEHDIEEQDLKKTNTEKQNVTKQDIEKKNVKNKYIEKQDDEEEEEEADNNIETYCFCNKPESEDMIGCDFCDMWYHPECLGLDEQQAVSLTNSDSWMCPECEDKKCNSNKRGRPTSKVKPKRPSTDSDDQSTTKVRKQTVGKQKEGTKTNTKHKITAKNIREKKQSISKKYVSDKDTSDTEEKSSEESSPISTKSTKKYVSSQSEEGSKKPTLKRVVGLQKHQVVQKGSEIVKRNFSMSDSLSNSDDEQSSLEGSPSIIRIPMDASQLEQNLA